MNFSKITRHAGLLIPMPSSLSVTPEAIAVLKIDPLHGRATYRVQKNNDGPQTYRLHYTLFKGTIMSNLLDIYLTVHIFLCLLILMDLFSTLNSQFLCILGEYSKCNRST